jgi:hypothetical protein
LSHGLTGDWNASWLDSGNEPGRQRGFAARPIAARSAACGPALNSRFAGYRAFGSSLRKALKSPTTADLPAAPHCGAPRMKFLRTTVHKYLICAKLARKP